MQAKTARNRSLWRAAVPVLGLARGSHRSPLMASEVVRTHAPGATSTGPRFSERGGEDPERERLLSARIDQLGLKIEGSRLEPLVHTLYRELEQAGIALRPEVYLAEDSRLARKIALKFLPPGFVGDAERMRRFMREAKAASALNHPNIITVYEVGETPTAFIATEFIDGQSLRQRLRAGPIPLPEALDIAEAHGRAGARVGLRREVAEIRMHAEQVE